MITDIRCFSQQQLEEIWLMMPDEGKHRSAIISIVDPSEQNSAIFKDHMNKLELKFSDCRPYSAWKFPQYKMKAMSVDDARKVVYFLSSVQSSPLSFSLLIHCFAGICRSGAIGYFAQTMSNVHPLTFSERNKQIMPNEWVLDLLYQTRMEMGK